MTRRIVISDTLLEEAKKQGLTVLEMAKKYNLYRSSIYHAQKRTGIYLRRNRASFIVGPSKFNLKDQLGDMLYSAVRRYCERKNIALLRMVRIAILEYLIRNGEKISRKAKEEAEGGAGG